MESPYGKDASYNPQGLDRDKALEASDDDAGFLYCIHCERAYQKGYFRLAGGLQMCPYQGCDGDTVLDAWPWSSIADDQNPSYPNAPVLGKVYPMYGNKDG